MQSPALPQSLLASRMWSRLARWPWLGTATTLLRRFREDRLALTAGSLTFTSVISLVPLATVALALFAAFPMFGELQETLQRYLVSTLVPDNIAKQLLGYVTQFSTRANRLGAFGLVAFIVSSIALLLTIDRALNAIWRVRRPRPIGQRVLVYWSAMTLGPLFVAVSLAATSYALTASRGVVAELPLPRGFGLVVGSVDFVFVALGMSALFHYVPHTYVRWRHALAGGVFVAFGFFIAKRLLAAWYGAVPTYSMVYGAFAALPIFLIWMYACWCIVLGGAVVAAYAPVARMRVVRWDGVGSRFRLAVAMLRVLRDAQRQGTAGLTATVLAEVLEADPLQTDPLLDTLVAIDFVGRLDEAGEARYVLLREPSQTSAEPLLGHFLLDPSPDLGPFWRRARFDSLMLLDLLERE